MNKRASKATRKTSKETPVPLTSQPESPLQQEVWRIVNERYPSRREHDPRLVAEIASRLATRGRDITEQDGARLASSAINLLNGVRTFFESREKSRLAIFKGLLKRAEIPEHLGWAEGKLFILGTDGGGSDARFEDLMADKLRYDKYAAIRDECIAAGKPEPKFESISKTTAKELNALRTRFEKEGFYRSSLESMKSFYEVWRVALDGRRKKAKKVLGKRKK